MLFALVVGEIWLEEIDLDLPILENLTDCLPVIAVVEHSNHGKTLDGAVFDFGKAGEEVLGGDSAAVEVVIPTEFL